MNLLFICAGIAIYLMIGVLCFWFYCYLNGYAEGNMRIILTWPLAGLLLLLLTAIDWAQKGFVAILKPITKIGKTVAKEGRKK